MKPFKFKDRSKQERVDCPKCKGSGYNGFDKGTCPRCGGKGTVWVERGSDEKT
ncbi:unnamed protein product, partial [marine sediment metagenome]